MATSVDPQNSSFAKATGTEVPQSFVNLIEGTAYDVIMKPSDREQKSKDYKVRKKSGVFTYIVLISKVS